MRHITRAASGAVLIAALSCCGGAESSSPGNLEDVKEALNDAAIECTGEIHPYELEDQLQFGDPPSREFTCDVDGVTVRGVEWENANERGSYSTASAEMACGLGLESLAWIEGELWVLDTEGLTSADDEMIDTLADALGVDAERRDCDWVGDIAIVGSGEPQRCSASLV